MLSSAIIPPLWILLTPRHNAHGLTVSRRWTLGVECKAATDHLKKIEAQRETAFKELQTEDASVRRRLRADVENAKAVLNRAVTVEREFAPAQARPRTSVAVYTFQSDDVPFLEAPLTRVVAARGVPKNMQG